VAPASFLSDLRDGWTAFRSHTWIWSVVAVLAVDSLLWGAWSALGPVVAEQRLGGAAAWGTVLAGFGIGALLGGLAALRVQPDRPLLAFAGIGVAVAAPIACLAAGAPTAVLAVGALLAGAGVMAGNTVWESTLQRHVPHEQLSRVSAYDWFGSMALAPVGLAMWGPIAAVTGLSTALWIACAGQLATTVVLLCIPDVRHLPAFPATPLAASRTSR
jgi:hypothetical protein